MWGKKIGRQTLSRELPNAKARDHSVSAGRSSGTSPFNLEIMTVSARETCFCQWDPPLELFHESSADLTTWTILLLLYRFRVATTQYDGVQCIIHD